MINTEFIPPESADEFFARHIKYLAEDGIVTDEEDMEYFVRGGVRIGAAQYNTYQSEDGRCFILDFWVFPEFRGGGTGHECFEALRRLARAEGAKYYELNSEKPDSVRFWKSLGFTENGKDEWGMPLFVLRPVK